MSSATIVEALLTLGRAEDYEAIGDVPGAGVHAKVLRFSGALRRHHLAQIEALSDGDRVAFAKALAVYEDTVGGLGRVTSLEPVLPLVPDQDHKVLDWILSRTRSYWYYANGATSYAALQAMRAAKAERRSDNEAREATRERDAKAARAVQASARLFNAVRRGDARAVQALLRQGANPNGITPDGTPLLKYAEDNGRDAVAELLRQKPGRASTA